MGHFPSWWQPEHTAQLSWSHYSLPFPCNTSLLNAFSYSFLLPGQEWPRHHPSSLNLKKKNKVLPSQLRSLDPALALPLLDRLVLYNFFCLAPVFLGTSLQTSDQPFSHHSIVHFSSLKLNSPSFLTQRPLKSSIKSGCSSQLLTLILRPVPLTLPPDATRNAWKSASLCLMRKMFFLDSKAGDSSGSHHPKFPAV